tara:strand:- start:3128 stop:3685 length:558 start_codon:yes stop_codon:yes gene_type:complete
MKTIILDQVLSQKELFYMYKQLISSHNWIMNGASGPHQGFMCGPALVAKDNNGYVHNPPFCLWGQSLIFKIEKLLESKKIGMPTEVKRMWFNVTFHGKKTQHWLHQDDQVTSKLKSIVLFMTPIWQPDWKGSFFVDGEEFKFKPGSAVIFDSREFHTGESPESETHNWQRLTCNIIVGHSDDTSI